MIERYHLIENIQKLQTTLNAINKVGKEYGLNINVSKIKLIMIMTCQLYNNSLYKRSAD